MQRRSTFILFTVLLILLTFSASAAWITWQERKLNESSSELALAITLNTLSSASAIPLLEVADPRFMDGWDADALQRYIDLVVTRLGGLQALTGIGGGINGRPLPFIGREIEAFYLIDLEFPETVATAEVTLVHLKSSWRVLDFRVDHPLLND